VSGWLFLLDGGYRTSKLSRSTYISLDEGFLDGATRMMRV
jgi:hypothetical protein